jgi:hypothetical protein
MFKILDKILSKIPGNGTKTSKSVKVFIVSMAIRGLADHLPIQPTDEQIDQAAAQTIQAIDLLSDVGGILGVTGAVIGSIHKGVKRVLTRKH